MSCLRALHVAQRDLHLPESNEVEGNQMEGGKTKRLSCIDRFGDCCCPHSKNVLRSAAIFLGSDVDIALVRPRLATRLDISSSLPIPGCSDLSESQHHILPRLIGPSSQSSGFQNGTNAAIAYAPLIEGHAPSVHNRRSCLRSFLSAASGA
jgi:hypothetical protein